MKRYNYLLAGLSCFALAVLSGCSNSKTEDMPIAEGQTLRYDKLSPTISYEPGVLHVKVNEDDVQRFALSSGGVVQMSSVPSQMSATLHSTGARKLVRIFPEDKRFEARQRAAGLHLWYEVRMDDGQDVVEAAMRMSHTGGIERAEPVPYATRPKTNISILNDVMPLGASAGSRTENMPFDDIHLWRQWHFNNLGSNDSISDRELGADIDLFNAWKVETGKPNVIVSIVDGGIEYEHEDLREAMWVNEAERTGQPGVDDDDNGYIDDIYGYNFVYKPGTREEIKQLSGDDHGTHVAGIVAARNNNGVGGGGVAGGNGAPNTGVRLQSAQVFEGTTQEMASTIFARAIVYGANNGAVISQNSWGYPHITSPAQLPTSIKDAINYFVQYAGCDEDGNQLPNSPMKGGVVIFAAGNDDKEFMSWPAAYESVIAVTGMGADFIKGAYTNRGTWADIMAPGGDPSRGGAFNSVFSTVTKNPETGASRYGYQAGTSMACPHVSGIAALVVSKYGGRGFTADKLKEILLTSFLPENIDAYNPKYVGKIGKGYASASAALQVKGSAAPEKPEFTTSTSDYTEIKLEWLVPADADDGTPWSYKLYMSQTPLSVDNYTSGKLLSPANRDYIPGSGYKVGETMSFSVTKLETDNTYYFALVAYDRWGHASEVAFSSAATLKNTAPQVAGLPTSEILVNNLQSGKVELDVTDPEGHSWSYALSGDVEGVVLQREGDKLRITIRPVAESGLYSIQLTLRDEYGKSETYTIPYRIATYKAIRLIKPFGNAVVGLDQKQQEIATDTHYEVAEAMTYTVTASVSNPDIAQVEVGDNNQIRITPLKEGVVQVYVSATDGLRTTEQSFFTLRVVRDSKAPVYALYPLPARTVLNALVQREATTATFVVTSLSGQEVLRKTVTPVDAVATVGVEALATGSYRLTVITDRGTSTHSFVKR